MTRRVGSYERSEPVTAHQRGNLVVRVRPGGSPAHVPPVKKMLSSGASPLLRSARPRPLVRGERLIVIDCGDRVLVADPRLCSILEWRGPEWSGATPPVQRRDTLARYVAASSMMKIGCPVHTESSTASTTRLGAVPQLADGQREPGALTQTADRPRPSGRIRPSAFSCSSVNRMVGSLIPGRATRTSAMLKICGACSST